MPDVDDGMIVLKMNRIGLLLLVACGLISAQETAKVSPEREAALKLHVSKFWDGFVAGKYRESDKYVAEDSKEEFFSWPKKKIKGYVIDQILYTAGGKEAKVLSLVDTTMAMLGVGTMDIKQPVETWWKEEENEWFWFQPKNQIRETPFGRMESNRESGSAPLSVAGQFNVKPDINALLSSVKPDRQQVNFNLGVEKVEVVKFTNSLPGTVTLTLDSPVSDELKFELSSASISRDGTSNLTITYKPKPAGYGEKITKSARVGVVQTGKVYEIKVVFDPKKD